MKRERFVALSPDLLGVVDVDGRVRQANPAWSTATGLDSAAVRRKDES